MIDMSETIDVNKTDKSDGSDVSNEKDNVD